MIYKLRDTFLEDGFYVTQNYMNDPEYYAKFNLLGHEGVDFGHADKKKIVRSPLSGTVFVSHDKNYGDFVVVEDYQQQCAIYICHLENIVVTTGQEIKAGDPLGEMGQSGNSTGEHVHCNFVILKDGSNKYRAKKWNWGYLDLLYPRDTGATKKFEGVEDYTVQWGPGSTPESIQLDETHQQVKNLQEQVTGLLDNLKTKEKELSDEKERNAELNGKNKTLTDQVTDLSTQLGKKTSDAQHNLEECKKRDEIATDLAKTVEKIVNTDNFAEAATKAQIELRDEKTATEGILAKFEDKLKVQTGNKSRDERVADILRALDSLYQSKVIEKDFKDYLFVLIIGGHVLCKTS